MMLSNTDVVPINKDFNIRRQKSNEESKALWWPFLQGLGWNRSYNDFETYFNNSKSPGLLLAVSKDADKPVGHVGAVINTNSTGWVSVFIVDAAFRGKALGAALFKACMREFASSGTQIVGLDAVVEQKKTYERRGFVESPLGVLRIMMRPLVAKEPLPSGEMDGAPKVIKLRNVPPQLLVQHELRVMGFEREGLWTNESIFDRADVLGFAAVARDDPQSVDDLLAWTIVRRCSHGCRIGPLYATDRTSAKSVLTAAMNACTPAFIKQLPIPDEAMNEWSEGKIASDASLIVEMWTGNPDSPPLFDELGWNDAGVFYHRMWLNGKAPPQQSKGGACEKSLYAIFDAATG